MWCDSGEQQLIALPVPTPVSGFENLQLSDVSIDICLHLLNGLPLQFDDDDYFFFYFWLPIDFYGRWDFSSSYFFPILLILT